MLGASRVECGQKRQGIRAHRGFGPDRLAQLIFRMGLDVGGGICDGRQLQTLAN